MTKIIIYFFVSLLLIAGVPCVALAGFGVSPPYIESKILRPGTEYQQNITILRSVADTEMEAHVAIDAPVIGSWISIEPGLNFILPKDQSRVNMKVKIKAPKNAPPGDYSGQISITATPPGQKGAIAVSLGALININLTVTNDIHSDYSVRSINISDYEWPGQLKNNKFLAWLFRPLKVRAVIENNGNTELVMPYITLAVYGIPAKEPLAEITAKIRERISPYQTKEITVGLPSRLLPGQYSAQVKIHQDDKIIFNSQAAFTVMPVSASVGASGLSRWQLLFGIVLLLIMFGRFLRKVLFKFK